MSINRITKIAVVQNVPRTSHSTALNVNSGYVLVGYSCQHNFNTRKNTLP